MNRTGMIGLLLIALVCRSAEAEEPAAAPAAAGAAGTVNLSDGNLALTGKLSVGQDIWIGTNEENSDPLWIGRHNAAGNQSELWINLGDDAQAEDKLLVGSVNYLNGLWFARLAVQADGNVGIGTERPSARLEVRQATTTGPNALRIAADDGPNRILELGIDEDTAGGDIRSPGGLDFRVTTDNPLRDITFRTGSGNAPRLVIDNGGNVGVGTPNPGSALEVRGNAAGGVVARVTSGTTNESLGLYGDAFLPCSTRPCTLAGQTGWLKVLAGSKDRFLPLFD